MLLEKMKYEEVKRTREDEGAVLQARVLPRYKIKIGFIIEYIPSIVRGRLWRWVTLWLLALVEDIDAWNAFPWGHYVWRLIEDCLLQWFEVPLKTSDK
ncbi:Uncharacterized protein TCM_023436 [Theobroma cacao]|uniref:Uncharacterized protein n=1 Tax=Theobroma cacao TaxID=3641 RepID=A0A061EVE1_THECC|nr:Uncharacterized protein TCM_023436 [Theobroma cacao]